MGIAEVAIYALDSELVAELREGMDSDSFAKSVLKALNSENSPRRHPQVDLGVCEKDSEGLLRVQGKYYIPGDGDLRRRVIQSRHSHPAAGHPGRAATFDLIDRDYWWRNLRATINQFVANCDTCNRIKPIRHAPYG